MCGGATDALAGGEMELAVFVGIMESSAYDFDAVKGDTIEATPNHFIAARLAPSRPERTGNYSAKGAAITPKPAQ